MTKLSFFEIFRIITDFNRRDRFWLGGRGGILYSFSWKNACTSLKTALKPIFCPYARPYLLRFSIYS